MPKQQLWNDKIGFDNLGEKWKEIIQRIERKSSLSQCHESFQVSASLSWQSTKTIPVQIVLK